MFRHPVYAYPLLVLPMLGLSGCMVGPDYQLPEPLIGSMFHNAPKVQAPHESFDSDTLLINWWRQFKDPQLVSLVEGALAQNLELAQAVARVEQSRASRDYAMADLLPRGQLEAEVTRLHKSKEDPMGRLQSAQPGFERNSSLYTLGTAASWEPDLFGGLKRERNAAQALWQASAAHQAAVRLSIAAETADTYVVIRTLQARLRVVQQRIATQQDIVRLTRLRFDRGLTSEYRLRQAEGVLSTVSAQESPLQASLEQAMNSLDVLLGSLPGTHHKALAEARDIPSPAPIRALGTPRELLRRRPDIIAAERQLAASNERIGQAIAEFYPKVSLSSLLATSTNVSGNILSSDANLLRGTAGLRWRLFDFGRVDAQVKSAEGRYAEALAAYRQTLLQATADVENTLEALFRREQQAALLASGEEALYRARMAAYAGYQGGYLNALEVLDADDRLQQVQDEHLLANAATTRATIAAFKALGGGWDSRDEEHSLALSKGK